MAYTKKTWKNVPDTSDPPDIPEGQDALARFDAENMNRIEDGIEEALKLTANDVGAVPILRRLNGTDIFSVNGEGLYYCINVDKTSIPTTTQSGYLRVEYGDLNYKVIYWRPYNSHKEYVNVLDGGKWLGWTEIFTNKGGIIAGSFGIYQTSENYPKIFVGNDDEHRLEVEYYMNTLNLVNIVGERKANLSIRNPSTIEKKDIIKLWIDATTDYTIFGEHNKPAGTYTGTEAVGSSSSDPIAEARTIAISGIGNILLIQNAGDSTALVTPQGALRFDHYSSNVDIDWHKKSEIYYANGVLYIAEEAPAHLYFNQLGQTYTYYCI